MKGRLTPLNINTLNILLGLLYVLRYKPQIIVLNVIQLVQISQTILENASGVEFRAKSTIKR